jgi:hypothetical protein
MNLAISYPRSSEASSSSPDSTMDLSSSHLDEDETPLSFTFDVDDEHVPAAPQTIPCPPPVHEE